MITSILFADFYLDGGTAIVSVEEGGLETQYELDYSLPWDGRPRHITVERLGQRRTVPIGSPEEKEICRTIRSCLEDAYSVAEVASALETSEARQRAQDEYRAKKAREGEILIDYKDFEDPYPVPFDEQWLLVFFFVEKAYREGKIELHSG